MVMSNRRDDRRRSDESVSYRDSDTRAFNRRQILRGTGVTALALGAPGLAAAEQATGEVAVQDAGREHVRDVLDTDGFSEVAREITDAGRSRRRESGAGSVQSVVDLENAAVLRREGEAGYVLAAPLAGDDGFEPLDSTTGLRAHYADGSANVVFNAGDEASADAMNGESSTIDTVSAQADCRFSWVPGYYCDGVYDTETICTIIGGANAFIVGNDATGVGFVDDVLLPITGAAGAACGAEQFAELVVADWLGGCDSTNWEYELYYSRWWNPGPSPVIAPRCS